MRFCFWRWLQNHTRTTFFFRSSFSAIAAIFSELGLKGFWCVNGIWMMRNKLTSVELWNRLLNFVSRALQSTFVSVSFHCHSTRLLLSLLLPHFRPVLAMPEHRPYLKGNIPQGSQHNIMSNKEREREGDLHRLSRFSKAKNLFQVPHSLMPRTKINIGL